MEIFTLFQSIDIKEGHLLVDLTSAAKWYPTLYQIAFTIGLCIFIFQGYKKNFPLSSWLIISAYTTFFLILGSKLGAFRPEDWKHFFTTGDLISTGGKTGIGALILSVFGLILIVKALKFKPPVWGAFAFFLPAVMLVQRVGCMMAGCCYGTPTAKPMGVKYFGPGILRDQQIYGGHLSIKNMETLPVHNVPLYFLIVAVITIGILLIVKKHLRNDQTLVVISLLCMSTGRFFIEFFRDINSHHNAHQIVFGLKTLQWSILLVIIIMIYFLWKTERTKSKEILPEVYPFRNLMALLILSIAMMMLHNWFTPYERTVAYLQITLAVALNFKFIWQTQHQLKPKFTAAIMGLISLSVVAQNSRKEDEEKMFRENINGRTFFTGNFTHNHFGEPFYPCAVIDNTGCGGPTCVLGDSINGLGPRFNTYSFGVEYHFDKIPKKKGHFFIGIDGVMEEFQNPARSYNHRFYNIAPYFGYYFNPDIALMIGIRSGEIYKFDNLATYNFFHNLPMFSFRAGNPYGIAQFRFGLFDQYVPIGVSLSAFNTGFSINYPITESIFLRFGFDLAAGKPSQIYTGIRPEIEFINHRLTIAPSFGAISSSNDNNDYQLFQFALKVRQGF